MLRFVLLWLMAVTVSFSGIAAATVETEAKPAPTQPPVLNVVFLDQNEAQTADRVLTMADIQALPAAEFTTTTIWTEGEQQFRGVWLSDLMTYLEVSEGTIFFSALNEYMIEITLAEMVPGGPMLAYEWNGIPMSPRDKGPLWIVFPYDSDQKFQSESVYAQSIWQLDRIEVSR